MKINAYPIVTRAIEEGVRCGYHRAHKHADKPTEDAVIHEIIDAVGLALDEVIDWETGI